MMPEALKAIPSDDWANYSGEPINVIDRNEWTYAMHYAERLSIAFARHTINESVIVSFIEDFAWGPIACYDNEIKQIIFNLKRTILGVRISFIDLLIHEFAHDTGGDHRSEKFHEACCLIGAKWGFMKEQILEEAGMEGFTELSAV